MLFVHPKNSSSYNTPPPVYVINLILNIAYNNTTAYTRNSLSCTRNSLAPVSCNINQQAL